MVLDHTTVYLLLGSNMGARVELITKAIEKIDKQIGRVVEKSSFYETAAWGKLDQPSFINIALAVQTILKPLEVLHNALSIETELGRIREDKWGARYIDIDIIFFGKDIVHIPNQLSIPHPEMQNRKFVLEPIVEIEPHLLHPVLKKTVSNLLFELQDNLEVKKI